MSSSEGCQGNESWGLKLILEYGEEDDDPMETGGEVDKGWKQGVENKTKVSTSTIRRKKSKKRKKLREKKEKCKYFNEQWRKKQGMRKVDLEQQQKKEQEKTEDVLEQQQMKKQEMRKVDLEQQQKKEQEIQKLILEQQRKEQEKTKVDLEQKRKEEERLLEQEVQALERLALSGDEKTCQLLFDEDSDENEEERKPTLKYFDAAADLTKLPEEQFTLESVKRMCQTLTEIEAVRAALHGSSSLDSSNKKQTMDASQPKKLANATIKDPPLTGIKRKLDSNPVKKSTNTTVNVPRTAKRRRPNLNQPP